MKYRELACAARRNVRLDCEDRARRIIEERLKEIIAAELTLANLRAQYNELLDKDVEQHVFYCE